ncbi:luciferin 4-monooxygenase [Rhexocercosporidium sp. MPI-PUGE-AT-0058]|nr:luciferin 4-monooxygenase [Rhexocercosporidium sp. MPI-PUGE-AT-0058]
MSTPQNLLQLLDRAAKDAPSNGVFIYNPEWERDHSTGFSTYEDSNNATKLTYSGLRQNTQQESIAIQGLLQMNGNKIVLLHVDDHLEGVHWFWAIISAGGIPCLSSSFSKDDKQRLKHINMLQKLLNNPTIITSNKLVGEFEGIDRLQIWTFNQIDNARDTLATHAAEAPLCAVSNIKGSDIAVLMLTSGSTGHAKAVCLSHSQIIASVSSKSQLHGTSSKDTFLNWTGLDHVANLVEIHLHALSVSANQVHLPGAEVLHNPLSFLEKIHEHRVSYTFAPNFFLGTLLDLSCLRALISGGEANVVQTCAELTKILQQYNAPESFIRPGFGMTETCAGSIYNAIDCPAYDIEQCSEFANLGKPIPDLQVRIVRKDGSSAHKGEIGELQVSGAVLFLGYYNNKEETEKAFTEDGWFRTGDKGTIDTNGRLCLTGREKDLVIVNGLNLQPQGIESAIQKANIPGVTSTYTVVFGHRPAGSHTEVIIVVYLPTYDLSDPLIRGETATSIAKATVIYCGVRPYKIIPLEASLLQKSTLGKLSRPKIRKAFEEGLYDEFVRIDEASMDNYYELLFVPPITDTEIALVELCHELFGANKVQIGIDSNLLALGASSIDLLTLKMRLQKCLGISAIPITHFFSHPVLRDLAHPIAALSPRTSNLPAQPGIASDYDPVVILNPNIGSTKTPIWFIHPGMGEILIFMNLSRYITDRPVYALRARGFDASDGGYYTSMSEMILSYLSGIKRVQPHGPYALFGYSFGSILTFEITKILEASGEEVKFLGTIDQPPHFKERARTYDWYECAMTVAFFLGLMGEGYAYENLPAMRKLSQEEVLDHIFELAPPGRLAELCMTREKLDNWAELAWKLKVIARDYDPEGMVNRMDVFYTGPLVGLVKANTTEEWRRDFIGMWDEFVGDVRYYEVKGTHRTLISPPYLVGFWQVFSRVLNERGL